jgi:hypothetical protein
MEWKGLCPISFLSEPNNKRGYWWEKLSLATEKRAKWLFLNGVENETCPSTIVSCPSTIIFFFQHTLCFQQIYFS